MKEESLGLGIITRDFAVSFFVGGEFKPMGHACKNHENEHANWILREEIYCDDCFLEELRNIIEGEKEDGI